MQENIREELKGFCLLGYTNFGKKRPNFGGFWTYGTPLFNSNVNTSESYFSNGSEFVKSSNISRISQLNGAAIPRPNVSIGAPRCTFVYGGISSGEQFPRLYIKGAEYAEPTYSGDPLKIGDSLTYDINVTEGSEDLSNTSIIPATDIKVNNTNITPSIFPTYNIWQLIQSSNNNTYKKYYGCKFDDTNYNGARIFQIPDNNTVAVNVEAPPGLPATIKRIFPLSKDLMYESGVKIYYPTSTMPAETLSLSTEKGNCGFHLRFWYSSVQNGNEKTESSQINIVFGDDVTTNKSVISKFNLILLPDRKPILKYLDPLTNTWSHPYPIEGPSLQPNMFDVFIHFAGPVMLIGFSEDPSTWNVFNGINNKKISYGQNIYPQISADANISLTVSNMVLKFQYGPIAFNNVNKDQKPWTLDTTEYIKSYYKTPFYTDNADDISNVLQNNSFYNKNIEDHDGNPSNDSHTVGPTAYLDWRGNTTQLKFLSDTNSSTKTNNYIKWNTTVEGPIFLGVSDKPTKISEDNKEIVENLLDVSEYLTNWSISYTPDLDNKSFLKGTAQATLKNLALTPDGRNAIKLLEENVMLITLGGGYNETNTFFQGACYEVETTYDKTGSTTIIKCEDIATRVFTETRPTGRYIFSCCRYRDIIENCAIQTGLSPYLEIVESPENTDVNKWQDSIKLRVGRALYLTSSSVNEILSCNVTSTPLYDSILSKVLGVILHENIYPIFYWDPSKRKLRLTARNAHSDILTFMGDTTNENDIVFPNDRHGLLTNSYTITTNNRWLVEGFLITSRWANGILSESGKFKNKIPEIAGHTNMGWVGFPKIYYEDISNTLRQTQIEVAQYAAILVRGYLRKPYQNLRCSIYITKPLNPWGHFFVKTFTKDSEELTDAYFYGEVNYQFDKERNRLTADVVGESVPMLIPNNKGR